jgi:hypothetical protein
MLLPRIRFTAEKKMKMVMLTRKADGFYYRSISALASSWDPRYPKSLGE